MTADEFLEFIAPSLIEGGVKVNISDDLGGYGGWFSEEDKELCVWKHNPVYYETLIHEYCHFLQYRDKYEFWSSRVDDTDVFFDWLDGGDYSPYLVRKAVNGVIEIEHDCELMTIEKIKEHNIDIDIDRYSRMTSTYLFSYYTTMETRQWPKSSIYTDDILSLMPDGVKELSYYQNKRNLPKSAKKLLLEKHIA
jgi:hypothetical protein